VLRRTDRKLARADTPERLIEAFEWFRQQLGALRATDAQQAAGRRPPRPAVTRAR